jgi:signal transduction histidine kinase
MPAGPAGLSARLNLLSIGLVLLTAVAITGYFVVSERLESGRRLVGQGETVAQALAQTGEFGIYTEDDASLANVLHGIDVMPSVTYAAFRGRDGRLLMAYGKDPRLAIPGWTVPADFPTPGRVLHRDHLDPATGRRHVDLLAPVVSPEGGELSGVYLSGSKAQRVMGYVQVGIDREPSAARLRRFVLSAVAFTALLVLAGVGATFAMTRRIAAPIEALATFTRSVSEDRLDRLAATEGPREIRQLEIAFNEMLQRLESSRRRLEEQSEALEHLRQAQKMEAVGQLAGGVAHDFNNLMTVVLGQCELLRRREGADPFRRGIDEISKAGERAAALTRDLLAFGRRQQLMPKVLDLNAVLSDLSGLLMQLAGETVEVRTNPGADLWPVFADPGQVEQIVVNLVLNARDAMPDGGTLSIGTRNVPVDDPFAPPAPVLDRSRDHVLLCVTDTGTGMDEATRARVFEPFFTTKEVGKGTGLGLSSVYGSVLQSDGCIDVASAPGEGTTISIYLPRTDQPLEEACHAPGAVSEVPAGSGTLLLVEDGAMVRAMVRELLESFGYSVLEAGDGMEALRVAEAHGGPIDLLLSDVVMPGMSGRKLKDAIRETRPGLRVLFMSAYAEETVLRLGVDAEDCDFIQKPFLPDALGEKIGEMLARPPSVQ